MKTIRNIIVQSEFTALHSWADCDILEVEFLKELHRHIFKVQIKLAVTTVHRDLEFFMVKNYLDSFLKLYQGLKLVNKSCEEMCQEIYDFVKLKYSSVFYVSVFEDGENGSELIS